MRSVPDILPRLLRRVAGEMHTVAKPMVLALGVGMLGLVAHADEMFGPNISLSLFYALPIAMVTWYVGGAWGIIFAAFGGVASFAFNGHLLRSRLDPIEAAWGLIASVVSFAFVTTLIWCLKRAMENQRSLANTDDTTAIGNTRSFRAAAEREIARAVRHGQPTTAVYLDCDNFKLVNDQFGHTVGDALLRTIGITLQMHLRVTDHAARLGGDEFAILLPEVGEADARLIMGKIKDILDDAMRTRGWPVTFSIGVATFPTPPVDVEELLTRVDSLQYQVKSGGKNAMVFGTFTPKRPALAA